MNLIKFFSAVNPRSATAAAQRACPIISSAHRNLLSRNSSTFNQATKHAPKSLRANQTEKFNRALMDHLRRDMHNVGQQ